jgi:hypothetical protein
MIQQRYHPAQIAAPPPLSAADRESVAFAAAAFENEVNH